MSKNIARITVVKEIELSKDTYTLVYDSEGNSKELTKEEVDALTTEQMIEFEKANLEEGAIGLDDLLDLGGDLPDEVKWEVVSG